MLQGVFRRYSNGQRITRKYLENDENEGEVLDQMTELGKGSYIDFMENLGLPVKDLDSLYHDELDVEILPAYCNWTLINLLKFDKVKNTLVEPYLPNHKIGIVHFAGKNNDPIRNNKDFISKVQTVDGDIIDKKLRFSN